MTIQPSGRRIVQPSHSISTVNPELFDYLVQLVRDLEINFLDTQEIEVVTQQVVTSVNQNVTIVQGNVSAVTNSLNSVVSVFSDTIVSINSVIGTLDARVTSVADNIPFSAIINSNGEALVTQEGLFLRVQDSRDL